VSRRKIRRTPFPVVDAAEWSRLAARLNAVCPEKHDEILNALRTIVEAQEIISGDPFGRPTLGHVVTVVC
jgi:hypothetical protein